MNVACWDCPKNSVCVSFESFKQLFKAGLSWKEERGLGKHVT